MSVTPEAIWRDVEKRARSYFHVSLNCKSIDEVCNSYKIQKASLLRDVCLKNGIQIHLRNYDLTSKNKLPFTDEVTCKKYSIKKYFNLKPFKKLDTILNRIAPQKTASGSSLNHYLGYHVNVPNREAFEPESR